MAGDADADRVKELELRIEHLEYDVDRYRSAMEDSMQLLGWCIGYFTGCNKASLARALGGNLSSIRRRLLKREEVDMPATPN
ncbi:hypothetical protein [Pedococcus sp. 5OH_020]|jgi:hypothetical protein|uniref:hypothetical protein n=1 Tax=Pedococcus sp. 5OH_020 TaxID=2989814 RepID=UPI0022E9F850|nr:hypothetical protein [Pedococcus sp. 5OH_020]